MSEVNVDLKETDDSTKEVLTPEEMAGIDRAQKMGRAANETSPFRIPTEFVPLPSFGLVYPPTSPLYNVKEIELRYMTAADEDILTSRSLLRSGKAIDAVLQNCIVDKRINAEQLISGDKNALVTFLRVSGYGPEYSVEISCPSCGEESKYDFDLSQLEMKTLDIEPVEPGENRFPFTLPSMGAEIEFKFLNSAEEKEISDAQDKLKKTTRSPVDRNVTTRLKNTIISVQGNTDHTYINQFVDSLNVRDSRAIRKYMEDNTPDLDMKQEFSCVHCGHRGEVDIPITVGFFWPDE